MNVLGHNRNLLKSAIYGIIFKVSPQSAGKLETYHGIIYTDMHCHECCNRYTD